MVRLNVVRLQRLVETTTPALKNLKIPEFVTLNRVHLFFSLVVIFGAVYNYLFVGKCFPFQLNHTARHT